MIDQYSFLNVFKYLTFRTGLSVVTSLVIVFIIGSPLIKLFSSKNSMTQIKFLSDIPNIVDIIKILIYLPKKKFLQYALGIHKNENK